MLAVSLGFVVLGGCARAASTTTSVATEPAVVIATPMPQALGIHTGKAVAKPAAGATTHASVAAPVVAPPSAASGVAASPSPTRAPAVVPSGTQILSVSAKPAVVHAGGTVAWLVLTTNDVTSVVAHVATYSLPLQRVAPGRFALNFSIPANVPGFFHGRYDLTVHAQSGSGASAERLVSLTFE